jgi:hypothetical protein
MRIPGERVVVSRLSDLTEREPCFREVNDRPARA